MSNRDLQGEEIKPESSWAGPARIAFMTLLLAAIFLYYYFGPSVDELQGNAPKASASEEPIELSVAGSGFRIPENYTVFGRSRRGGVQDKVDLYAILPGFDGYTLPRQVDFEANANNSPVIYFSLYDPQAIAKETDGRSFDTNLSERDRFERIYLPHAVDPDGENARAGLTRYELGETWGYQDEDIFVREEDNGDIILFACVKNVSTMPSPWCARDTMITPTLALNYRFKRERLGDWRDIDKGIRALIERFTVTDMAPAAPAAVVPSAPADPAAPAETPVDGQAG